VRSAARDGVHDGAAVKAFREERAFPGDAIERWRRYGRSPYAPACGNDQSSGTAKRMFGRVSASCAVPLDAARLGQTRESRKDEDEDHVMVRDIDDLDGRSSRNVTGDPES
jgi:hypothetical protein